MTASSSEFLPGSWPVVKTCWLLRVDMRRRKQFCVRLLHLQEPFWSVLTRSVLGIVHMSTVGPTVAVVTVDENTSPWRKHQH